MEKIEVLYICHTSTIGGAAKSLFNMICSLKDKVVPIVLLPKKGPTYDLFVKNGIKCIVYPFRWNVRTTGFFSHWFYYIPHVIYDNYVKKCCVKYIMHELGGHDIKIVHSNTSIITIGHYLSKALSAKHVWHIREFQDLDFGLQPYYGWEDLKKKIYMSDAVVAISRAVYKHWNLDAAMYGCCIWNAVRSKKDVVFIRQKEKYFFFCAAVLCDAKGTKFAIEAFSCSGLANFGYKLVIAGSSSEDYRMELEVLIRKKQLIGAVDFIGFCENVKVYMAKASAFLMCSENEGLGRVTIEAMFYGCPIIGRNTGGTLDFIKDKENGLLFSDLNTCVKAMRTVVANDNSDMVCNAQRFAVENFSEENYGCILMDVYTKVLS